jgi:flagellar motility protein MotE (MotC chaperone)
MSEDKIPYVTKTPPRTSEETRLKDPVTGAEKGSKEARFDLIPAGPLFTLARVFGRGAKKYAERNWERGYPWSWSFAALMRHAWAFWRGEELDQESGLPHLAHAAWHCFVLQEFTNCYPDKDDRSKMRRDEVASPATSLNKGKQAWTVDDWRASMQEVAKEKGITGLGGRLCSRTDESELQRRFDNLQNVIAGITEQRSVIKAELAQAREEQRRLATNILCLETTNASLMNESAKLRESLASSQCEAARLVKTVEHWKACLTSARSALSTAEAEVAELRDHLSPKPQACFVVASPKPQAFWRSL